MAAVSSGCQSAQQILVVFPNIGICFSKFSDFTAGMQDCRVIPATKCIAYLRQTVVGQLLGQRHRYLPWPRHRTRTTLGRSEERRVGKEGRSRWQAAEK